MAGNYTTLTVLDYVGNQKTMRVWDESGTGAGPFQFVKQADVYGTPITGASLAAGGLGMAGWLSQIAYYLSLIYNYTTGGTATNIATNQVSVGTSATAIIAARTTRNAVLITNEGPIDIRIGASGVTTGNGFLLPVGATVTVDGGGAVYGIAASGTVAVSYMEVY